MYRIRKIVRDGKVLLPCIKDTSIWKDYNKDCNKNIRLIAMIYEAIANRENFYQQTPTAIVNPQYNYYCGVVVGLLKGNFLEEKISEDAIIIKDKDKRILVIEQPI